MKCQNCNKEVAKTYTNLEGCDSCGYNLSKSLRNSSYARSSEYKEEDNKEEEWRPNFGRIKFSEWVFNAPATNSITVAKVADRYAVWLEKTVAKKVAYILGYHLVPRGNCSQCQQEALPRVKLIHNRRSSYRLMKK